MNSESLNEISIVHELTSLPLVHDACCTVEETNGAAGQRYAAYFCSRDTCDMAEVVGVLKNALPANVDISLFQVDSLPRTLDGAIDFDALRLLSGASAGEPEWGEKRRSQLDGGPLPRVEPGKETLQAVLHRVARCDGPQRLIFKEATGRIVAIRYAELAQAACCIASGLIAQGIGKGKIVIVAIADQRAFLGAFWACVEIGAVPLPVALPLGYETNEGAKLLAAWRCLDRPPVLVSRHDVVNLSEYFPNIAAHVVESLADGEPVRIDGSADPEDLALLLATSGSTGAAKFVMHSHRSLLAYCCSTVAFNNFTPLDVSFNWFPFDHVGGLVMFHLRDLFVGCTQLHARTDVVLARPLRWLDWMSEHRVTVTWAPNFAFAMLAREKAAIAAGVWDLSSLRFILNGGEAVVAAHAQRFLDLLVPHGLKPEAMHPAWGMSETSSGVLYANWPPQLASGASEGLVSVGVPIPGVCVRVVGESGEVLPQGQSGELEVLGASLTSGYYRNEETTTASFTQDGWFKTGDRAVIAEDQVAIVGRSKEMIIINGRNYACTEIEEIAADTPGVRPEAVAAVGLRSPGAISETIGILVALTDSYRDQQQEVTRALSDRLVSQLLCVRPFVRVAEATDIPRTSIGKARRNQVKESLEREWRATLPPQGAEMLDGWPGGFARLTYRIYDQGLGGAGASSKLSVAFGWPDALDRLTQLVTDTSGVRMVALADDDDHSQVLSASDAERALHEGTDDGSAVRDVVYVWSVVPERLGRVIADLQSLLRAAQASRALGTALRLRITVVCFDNPGVALVEAHAAAHSLSAWLRSAQAESRWLRAVVWDGVEWRAGETRLSFARLFESCVSEPLNFFRNGRWMVPRLVPVESRPASASRLMRGGVYVIVGGLGGVGRVLSEHLRLRYTARLVMIGRRAFDDLPAEQQMLIDGEHALYIQADVTDLASLEAACKQAEEHFDSPVRGAFHLAGVLSPGEALSQPIDAVERALRPKVDGTSNLLEVIGQRCSGIIVLFSSVAGCFGGSGIAAHAAASGFQLGISLRAEKCDVYALAWSTWGGIGQSNNRQDTEVARARGFCTLAAGDALSAFDVVMTQAPSAWVIGVDARNLHVSPWFEQAPAVVERVESVASYAVPALRTTVTKPETARRTSRSAASSESGRARAVLEDIWRTLLEVEIIHDDDSFFDLGGHSLMIPAFLEQTERHLGVKLMPSDLFRYPHFANLVAFVDECLGSRPSPLPDAERVAQTLRDIWGECLALDDVDEDENFFDLGGHSLLIPKMIERIDEQIGVRLLSVDLFKYPTLSSLSARLRDMATRRETSARFETV